MTKEGREEKEANEEEVFKTYDPKRKKKNRNYAVIQKNGLLYTSKVNYYQESFHFEKGEGGKKRRKTRKGGPLLYDHDSLVEWN